MRELGTYDLETTAHGNATQRRQEEQLRAESARLYASLYDAFTKEEARSSALTERVRVLEEAARGVLDDYDHPSECEDSYRAAEISVQRMEALRAALAASPGTGEGE